MRRFFCFGNIGPKFSVIISAPRRVLLFTVLLAAFSYHDQTGFSDRFAHPLAAL